MIYDVSLKICQEMIVYPGDSRPTITSLNVAGECRISELNLGSHTGTHVDSPAHFIKDGKTIDQMQLECFVGKCLVVELKNPVLTEDFVKAIDLNDCKIIIFKTNNSNLYENGFFDKNATYISGNVAQLLASMPILTVGWDWFSVEDFHAPEPIAHKTILGAGKVIIEGLMLKDVSPGFYFISALPLKLDNCDGSPVRAVLLDL